MSRLHTLAVPLALALAAAGCAGNITDHCASCVIVGVGDVKPNESPRARAGEAGAASTRRALFPADARALVVLVHGAFGFGDEWDPLVASLRKTPEIPFVVFAWNGPFHDLTPTVNALAALLQNALAETPALREVLVLAHSAGGPVATRAVRLLRVGDGQHVRLAAVAPPSIVNGRPFFHDRIDGLPDTPPGVERVEYLTENPPRAPAAADPRRVYLGGKVSHNPSLAVAGLPLLDELVARTRAANPPPPAVPAPSP